jgi:hypothetical protein
MNETSRKILVIVVRVLKFAASLFDEMLKSEKKT